MQLFEIIKYFLRPVEENNTATHMEKTQLVQPN